MPKVKLKVGYVGYHLIDLEFEGEDAEVFIQSDSFSDEEHTVIEGVLSQIGCDFQSDTITIEEYEEFED